VDFAKSYISIKKVLIVTSPNQNPSTRPSCPANLQTDKTVNGIILSGELIMF